MELADSEGRVTSQWKGVGDPFRGVDVEGSILMAEMGGAIRSWYVS
jgi:hypothetical protein